MPKSPKRPCRYPGCPNLCDKGVYCAEHAQYSADRTRGSAADRGYDAKWRISRSLYLKRHPLCAECRRNGKLIPATVVDHIMTEADMSPGAAAVADNTVAQLREKAQTHSPSERTKPIGKDIAAGIGAGMKEYSLEDAASAVALNATTAMSAAMSSDILRSIGSNMMRGLVAGINAGRSSVVSAMRRAANEAVTAAKTALVIESPSKVFRDEIGVMVMKGFGEGILTESKEQARTMSNAARYLTASAKEGTMGYIANDNRRSYTDNSAVNLTVSSMSVRDEQDIQSLAREIAALTRLQQRGKGLKGI